MSPLVSDSLFLIFTHGLTTGFGLVAGWLVWGRDEP